MYWVYLGRAVSNEDMNFEFYYAISCMPTPNICNTLYTKYISGYIFHVTANQIHIQLCTFFMWQTEIIIHYWILLPLGEASVKIKQT